MLISKEDLFAKRPEAFRKLYEQIVKEVKKMGVYREETVPPDVIFFKTVSTFLAIKVKSKNLEVEFFLDHHEEHPSVSKWLQTSKHRFAHVVPVDKMEDISKELIGWIGASFLLVQI